jgi:hypothetical protein
METMEPVSASARGKPYRRLSWGDFVRGVLVGIVGGAVAWGYGSLLGALLHLTWLGLVIGIAAGTVLIISLAHADPSVGKNPIHPPVRAAG